MKKTKLVLIFFFVIALGFNSCKKDDGKDVHQDFKDKYFEISDAVFVNEAMPNASSDSDAPTIQSIFGNHSVLSGGSNLISIGSTSNISYLLVGIEGITGYYKLSVSDLDKLSGNIYLFYLLMSQDLQLQNFTILVAILSNDNLVSQHSEVQVSQIEAGTGLLQVNCTWDKLNDVDLHLLEPSGEEIYYSNSYSANGGELDVDSNASCDIDGINNENITYSGDAIVVDGQYTVRVDLYSNCSVSGGTNYIVTAYYDGSLISTSSGSNPYMGTFTSSDQDYGENGSGKTVMKFTIDSSLKSASMNRLNLLSFKYPEGSQSKPKNLSPQK